MTLPSLPTDNLYKFISIFGLVLLIFFSYMINITQSEMYLKVDDYNLKNEILDFNLKNDSISTQLKAEKIKVAKLKESINRELEKLPRQYYVYIFGLFFGIAMMGVGFYLWFYRTQYYNDLNLKNESENLRNTKELSVHKLQFEKEFVIYQQLWELLVNLKVTTSVLRPQFEYVSQTQTSEEAKVIKLQEFNLAFRECLNGYEKNKPFYSKEIHDEITKTILLAKKEFLQYNKGKSYTEEYWENAEKNIKEIIDTIDIVCEKIRARIGLIKIEN